jgi:hypothetical protein
MNNIQKSFANKRGLLHAATGYVPTDGEKAMLGRFDERMASYTPSAPAVSQPFAAAPATPLTPAGAALKGVEYGHAKLSAVEGMSESDRDTYFRGRVAEGFADGMVPETSEQLLARMSAKYGVSSTSQPEPKHEAPQQQAPAPQPKQQGLAGAYGALRDRAAQLNKAAGFADGEVPHEGPGIVHGPGGPREDKVDAKLSDGEAVLPAATVLAMGGPDAVAELIEQTNGKSPQRGLRDGQETVHASKGFTPEFLLNELALAAQEPEFQHYDKASLKANVQPVTTPEIGQAQLAEAFKHPSTAPLGERGKDFAINESLKNAARARANIPQPALEGEYIQSGARGSNTGADFIGRQGDGGGTGRAGGAQARLSAPISNVTDVVPVTQPTMTPAGTPPAQPRGPIIPDSVKGLARGVAKASNAFTLAESAVSAGRNPITLDENNGASPLRRAATGFPVVAADIATSFVDGAATLPIWAANKAGIISDETRGKTTGAVNQMYRDAIRDKIPGVNVPKTSSAEGSLFKGESSGETPDWLRKMTPTGARELQEGTFRTKDQLKTIDANAKIVSDGYDSSGKGVNIRPDLKDAVGSTAKRDAKELAAYEKRTGDVAKPNYGKGTALNADGSPDLRVGGMNGYERFDNARGAADVYAKAGYNTVTGLKGGQAAILGISDADRATDARMAASGAKKDIYGNWDDGRVGAMKAQLREMQKDRFTKDVSDPNLAPQYVAAAQRGLAQFNTDDANLSKNAITPYQQATLAQHERDTRQMQGNTVAAAKAAEGKDHQNRLDDMIKSLAGDPKDPAYNTKYANLQKYAGKFVRADGMSSSAHLSEIMDNYAVDSLFDKEGRHLLGNETPRDGEVVMPKVREAGMSALLHGRAPGQNMYTNPLTNEKIYESDAYANLSPRARQILRERVSQAKKIKE